MLNHNNKLIPLLLTAILVLSTIPMIVNASAPEKINVIIGFKNKSDDKLITNQGGTIKYQYSIVNAIAASIPENAINALCKNPQIAYIENDHQVEALGQTLEWGVDRIDADVVHTYPNKGTSDIQVAIIDSGIDYNHPDLYANCITGTSFVSGDWMDDNGHGTHCAGIVGALDNTKGVIGVAPEIGLYGVKVLDRSGGGYISDVVAGIEWAVKGPNGFEGDDDDAEVISMSFGGGGHSTLENAVNYAYTHGTLLVAAAGNNGNPGGGGDNVDYPARYDSVIAVAASDSNDGRAKFSSTGPDVELTAPGVNIYSTYWDDTYAYGSGTSMACPHVAGVAALVFNSPLTTGYDYNGNGVWDPDEVRQKMDDTAIDLGLNGRDTKYGYGLVYAAGAVDEPKGHDVAVTAINAPSSIVQGETETIYVTVENQGSFDETFEVVLKDTAGSTIGIQSVLLTAGESKTIVYSWDTTGVSLGDHTLTATAGPVTDETDTTDNSKSVVVTIELATTDIAITAVNVPSSVTQGDQVNVDVTVENIGNQEVTDDITVILTDDTEKVTIGSQIIGALTAGASTILTYTWDTTSVTLGDHLLNATHDFIDDDTSNDAMSTMVTVNEPTEEITITGINPNTMQAGATIEVTITGTGFVNGADVTLENGIGPAPTVSDVVVVDADTITATVYAKDGGPPKDRVWDVRVTNPDGSSAVLLQGFTVTP